LKKIKNVKNEFFKQKINYVKYVFNIYGLRGIAGIRFGGI